MFPERRAERRRRRARQKSLRADFSHPGPGGKTRCSWDSLLSFFCQLHCNFLHTGVFIWVFFFFFSFSRPLWSPKLSQTLPLAAFLDLITKCSFYTRLSHQWTVTGFTVPSCSCSGRPGYQFRLRCCTFWVKSLLWECSSKRGTTWSCFFFAPSFCVHSVPLSWI